MRRRSRASLVGALLLVALAGCVHTQPRSVTSVSNPFRDSLWDDGRAEVALYSGTIPRYGTERPLQARTYVVKEDVLDDALVKSDAGPVPGRTTEAVKMNLVLDFPTGTYAYHQMASVSVRRDDLRPLKETMSSTEGCGITFVRLAPRDGRLAQEVHSYWEGEADRVRTVPATPTPPLWKDALPLTLREYAAETKPFERRVWVLPGQVSSHSPDSSAVPLEGTLRLVGTGPLSVPDGAYQARHFSLTTARGTDLYWFDVEKPHVLLKVETAEGLRLELMNVVRLDYWKHTAPGEERLLLE